jgi:hypothetical protein
MKSENIEFKLRNLNFDIKSNLNSFNTGIVEIDDDEIESSFIELFNELYEKSVEENYFWEYCSFKTYKETFQNRFESHKIDFPDDYEIDDFIDFELSELHKSLYIQEEVRHPYEDETLQTEYDCFIFSFYDTNTHTTISISLDILYNFNNLIYKLKKAYSKKIKFLNELKSHNENEKLESETIESDNYPKLDLSNTFATEKIIFLKELGILDFLREQQPFNTSTNSLATVLSAITGENNLTLQSYINPIFSKETSQKNNPLKKDKVDNVKTQLIQIGFKPK